jgi:hypothetical protein
MVRVDDVLVEESTSGEGGSACEIGAEEGYGNVPPGIAET